MDVDISGLSTMREEDFRKLEIAADKIVSVWHIKITVANQENWHGDQQLGQKRRVGGWPRNYLTGPGIDDPSIPPLSAQNIPLSAAGLSATLRLEGQMLTHSPDTWILEFNEDGTMVRNIRWSFGIQGDSYEWEKPETPIDTERNGVTMVRIGGTWRPVGARAGTRTTKNSHPKDWVHHMHVVTERPPMTPEYDSQHTGKYGYHPTQVRGCVPAAPDRDTWQKFPNYKVADWANIYLPDSSAANPNVRG